ncbi:alpha/beta hydrolase [soil metagenome]
MRKLLTFLIVVVVLAALGLAGAIRWGGPGLPTPLEPTAKPVGMNDLTGLPKVERYVARDGTSMAYRHYVPPAGPARASITLLHGFSSRSQSLHAVARALAGAGFEVFALDVRGHGDSGVRGAVDYVGQLDDDLADYLQFVKPAAPRLLAGFSAGGGLALRTAGSARGQAFDAYLLVAPYLGPSASTNRSSSAGVAIGKPRRFALDLVNRFGIHRYNGMPLTSFAMDDLATVGLTPLYSYALASSFAPQADYKAQIRAIGKPLEIVVGANDENFIPDQFAAEFESAGHAVPVTIVANVGHRGIIVEAPGIQAIVDSAIRLVPNKLQ